VSIAAHSPLMDSIQNDWNAAVDACALKDAEIPVIGNVHAKVIRTAEELRADIKAQMQSACAGRNQCKQCLGWGFRLTLRREAGKSCWG